MIDPLVKTPYYVRREAQENNLRMRLESRALRRDRLRGHVYDLVLGVGLLAAFLGALTLAGWLS